MVRLHLRKLLGTPASLGAEPDNVRCGGAGQSATRVQEQSVQFCWVSLWVKVL